mgnify:CR=1 FL=1
MQGFLSFLSFLLWVGGGHLMWHRWIVAALWQGLRRSRFSLSGCSAGNSRRVFGLFSNREVPSNS